MENQVSVRTYLYIAIFLMGALGVFLVINTSDYFRKIALESQQQILGELVLLQSGFLQQKLETELADLGYSLQSETPFLRALKTQSRSGIRQLLEQQFQRQFAEDGIILLTGMAVYDLNFQALAFASRDISDSNKSSVSCPQIVLAATQREGIDRFKSTSGFCQNNDQIRFSVFLPIGGFKPYAYFYLETDPTPAFAELEKEVGMPIALSTIDETLLYESPRWQNPGEDFSRLNVNYNFGNNLGSPSLNISAAYDTSGLIGQLKSSRNLVVLVVTVISLLAALLLSAGMQKHVVSPLKTLANRLHGIRENKSQLGQQVEISGNFEVAQLAKEFNSLSVELKNTYETLELVAEEATLASRAKSSFLANMSHEIRTPLTSIIGFAQLALNSEQSDDERISGLKTIVASGRHLLGIINDILDLSKIEADKLQVEQTSVSPIQLIKDVQALVEMQASEKNLQFDVELHFPLPSTIHSDSLRLKQVLLNLCSNAIKFTEQGWVKVSLQFDSDRQLLHFSIEDSGIGLTQEQIKNIFIPFNQANVGTTRKFGGTGLGLSLSKHLTEMLGGELSVQSHTGVGSCFNLLIPTEAITPECLLYSDETSDQKVQPDDRIDFEQHQFVGRVLLVEDNAVNQLLIEKLLCRFGADVVLAENGQMAIDEVERHSFDLILMDLQMPVMGGIEATQKLRQSGYEQTIVALTANTMKEDKQRCLQSGFDDFISKPIDYQKLLSVLAQNLKKSA
ncbi:MAG: response regulator [Gammaproteobacteria bacterium]|nr:response regulator [Gammaproteobacteria bacterium]